MDVLNKQITQEANSDLEFISSITLEELQESKYFLTAKLEKNNSCMH